MNRREDEEAFGAIVSGLEDPEDRLQIQVLGTRLGLAGVLLIVVGVAAVWSWWIAVVGIPLVVATSVVAAAMLRR